MEPYYHFSFNLETGTPTLLGYQTSTEPTEFKTPLWVTQLQVLYYGKLGKWKIIAKGYRPEKQFNFWIMVSDQQEHSFTLDPEQKELAESYWVFSKLTGGRSKEDITDHITATYQYI